LEQQAKCYSLIGWLPLLRGSPADDGSSVFSIVFPDTSAFSVASLKEQRRELDVKTQLVRS